MAFLDSILGRPNNSPVFTTPTLPMPGPRPRTPAPQPIMPVIGGPGGIGGPAPMPGPAPIRMPIPPPSISPEGILEKLMLQRDQLQASLDQVNAKIQELMQGQSQGQGSGFPERKPQEGIGNLLEQLLRNQSERGGFGD